MVSFSTIERSSNRIDFTSNGNSVLVTIPYLKYWDMIVVEY